MKDSIVRKRLEELMALRVLTQGQVATFTGLNQQNVSKILDGSEPKIPTLIALARGLDVSLDWLAGLPLREPGILEPDEEELLKAYRALDEAHRKAVLGLARDLGGK